MADEHEIQLTLRVSRSAPGIDALLTSDPNAPMSQVLEQFAKAHPGPYFLDGRELTPVGRLADSALRNGAVVYAGQPGPRAATPKLELVVVGGADAGRRFALTPGVFAVGSSDEADIVLHGHRLAPVHFSVSISGKQIFLDNFRKPQSILLEGKPVDGECTIELDQLFRVGDTLFEIRRALKSDVDTDADVTVDGNGRLVFNRPARIPVRRTRSNFESPKKPQAPTKQGFPWAQVFIPLVFSVGAAYLFHSPAFLMLGLMGPALGLASAFSNKRQSKKDHAKATADFGNAMVRLRQAATDAAQAESKGLRARRCDAAMVADIAMLPRRRLWERRVSDKDFLTLRLGSADMFSSVEVVKSFDAENFEAPVMFQAPVSVNLRKVRNLGVAGPMNAVHSAARWLVTQLTTLHSPSDVRLFLLASSDSKNEWSWMRWLPHTATSHEPGEPFCTIATDRYARDEHIKALLQILDLRQQAKERREEIVWQSVVVVYDGIRDLRELPGVARLLREGPEHSIYSIGLDSATSRLAQETAAEIAIEPQYASTARLRVAGQETVERFIVDQVSSTWSEDIARSIAPYIEAGREVEGEMLPAALNFVEMTGVNLDNPDSVLARWSYGDGRTTRFPIGKSLDGEFSLDLKHDGPHGLVAGTTGAGKSEFLQTLVASLALANRPDALNFLLIDYKGASAFSSCEDLPHTVGLVTNLDGHLTKRALVALEAELHRREQLLKDMHASDVDAAWLADPEFSAENGLARLVIVIDEFAELNQELPDFIQGLIRVARIGRSLGVHLILGTQRPAGVVSPEMRANTGLRIALRMEDRNDSTEVLESPEAATISRRTPGRAYARLGGASSIVPFQTARVAGRRRDIVQTVTPPRLVQFSWEQVGRPLFKTKTDDVVESETTDLHALVTLINKAAELSAIPEARSPWLPPLPKAYVVPLDDEVVFGLIDEPKKQTQPFAVYDLETSGHLLFAGSARSGRSTALRTLAGAIANTWSPSDCHIVGLDFGNGALQSLTALPHCGVVTGRSENERIGRVISRLRDEVTLRQGLFARAGFGDIKEQRQHSVPDEKLPYIVVFLDRWEGFLSEFSVDIASEMPDEVMRLLREGPGVGLRFVITGDNAILSDRVSAQIDEKIVLRLNNKDSYAIAGIAAKSIPDDMPDGRGIQVDTHADIQIGLLAEDSSTIEQNRALANIAELARNRWPEASGEQAPLRVDALPEVTTLENAQQLPIVGNHRSALSVLVGVGGDRLSTFYVDMLEEGPFFVVAGQARSGRSTAALVMAESVLANGGAVVAVCPRRSPLEGLAGMANAAVFHGNDNELEALVETLNSFEQPVLIIVDDSHVIAGNTFDIALRDVVKKHSDEVAAVVIGSIDDMRSQLQGIAVDARRSKLGLLFSPEIALDGELVGMRLPRNKLGRTAAGRAVFCDHGNATVVQIPLA